MYDYEDWEQHWRSNDLPWTGAQSDQALDAFEPFVRTNIPPEKRRALVPLAGNSLAVRSLYDVGYEVTAVEYVPEAAARLRDDSFPETKFTTEDRTDGQTFLSDRVAIFQQDIFLFKPDVPFSLIYDRGAYVALPADDRKRYATLMLQHLAASGFMILRTAEMIGGVWKGPPFSIADAEVITAYGELKLIKKLEEQTAPTQERYVEAGIEAFLHRSYLFQAS